MDFMIAIPGFIIGSVACYFAPTTWCIVIPLLYFSWRVIFSQSHFHLIWSVSLTACGTLKWLASQASSISTLIIWVLCCAMFLFVSLIPIYHIAKRLIYGAKGNSGDEQSAVCLSGDEPPFVDIVAVHGLGSHSTTAWEGDLMMPDNKRVMWLRDFLCKEEDLRCRVILFQYNSQWVSDANNEGIAEYGQELLQALRRKRLSTEEQCRPIIFIGHSFGGLVIKQMLVIAGNDNNDPFCTELCRNTKSIIFMGTPHKGAKLTKFGRLRAFMGHFIGSSTALLDFVDPTSEQNEELHRRFMRWSGDHLHMKDIRCIYETIPHSARGLPLIEIVAKESAVLDGCDSYPRHKTHRELQRFNSCKDDAYKDLIIWIRQKLESIPPSSRDLVFLDSLGFPKMLDRWSNITEPFDDTCAWIWGNKTFQAWSQHQVLWIKGSPGSGKSTMMSFIQAEADRSEMKDPINKFLSLPFYFDGQSTPIARSLEGLLRTLLHHIYKKAPMLRSQIRHSLGRGNFSPQSSHTGLEWNERHLENAVLDAIDNLTSATTVILIDALDEALRPEVPKVIKFLKKLCTRFHSHMRKLRICVSCRTYPPVASINGLQILMQEHNRAAVSKYLAYNLSQEEIDEVRHLDQVEWSKVVQELVQKAGTSFQWASTIAALAREYVPDGHPIGILKAKLLGLPQELGDLYEHILTQVVKSENWTHSLRLLQWVCLAQRSLSIEELRYAMALENLEHHGEHQTWEELPDFVHSNESMALQVAALSGGLVEVLRYKNELTFVRVTHQSVAEFVLSRGLNVLSSRVHFPSQYTKFVALGLCDAARLTQMRHSDHLRDSEFVISASHMRIFVACLLFYRRETPLIGGQLLEKLERIQHLWEAEVPFLLYASKNIFTHLQRSQKFVSETGISWRRLISITEAIFENWYGSWGTNWLLKLRRRKTLLHVAAEHGLEQMTDCLLSDSIYPVNVRDAYERTALHSAAKAGNVSVVSLLLRYGAWPTVYDGSSQSPLTFAAGGGETQGHLDTVRLLLKQGLDVNCGPSTGGSAIHDAAENGLPRMVELLLDLGANSNDTSGCDGTPLYRAAFGEHAGVVSVLLRRGADPHIWNAWPPSRFDVSHHQQRISRLLEAAGVKVDPREMCRSQNTLPWPGESDDFDPFLFDDGTFFKLFFDPTDITNDDHVGSIVNLLACAAGHANRHSNLQRFTYNFGSDDIEVKCKNAALFTASAWGTVEAVQSALEFGAQVNALIKIRNTQNVFSHCKSALQAAVYRNSVEIVRFLLQHGADVNAHGGVLTERLVSSINCRLIPILTQGDVHGQSSGQDVFNSAQVRSSSTLTSQASIAMPQGQMVAAAQSP